MIINSNVLIIKSIIASPEGIERLTAAHPDVDIYCGVKDQGLNENKYIVPGRRWTLTRAV